MKRTLPALVLSGLVLSAAPALTSADETEDLLTLRNTVVGLLEDLVASGAVNEEQARVIVDTAQTQAREEFEQIQAEQELKEDTVRVSYVPEVVKDELRDELFAKLREEVTNEVMDNAKEEGWGVPAGLPNWLENIRWTADMRVRAESATFADDNAQFAYPNIAAINASGSVSELGPDAFINTTEDRELIKVRMLLGIDAQLSEGWFAGLRLTTGNDVDPTSRDRVAGGSFEAFEAKVDLAYLHYKSKYFLFSGGRIPNPYMSTELIWDRDITFTGVAFTGLLPWRNHLSYLTVGAYPIEEVELSSRDKWLYAAQLGTTFNFSNGARIALGAAYYDYENIEGERNTVGSRLLDFTAVDIAQGGNTYFNIRNDDDPDTFLYGLASDYNLLNATFMLDSGPLFYSKRGNPMHVRLIGDYVKNIGYDEQAVFERTGLNLDSRDEGYNFELEFGHQQLNELGSWRLAALFRHLERDAALDAYVGSPFHNGGTDAEGWGVNFEMGINPNTSLRLRYLTANEIDGAPYGADQLVFDINTRFR